MAKGVICILSAMFMAAWPTSIFATPITYALVPLQGIFDSGNQVTVAGTITTNGVIGEFQASDITSWMFSVAVNSVVVLTETSVDATAGLLVLGSPVATATTIALPYLPAQPPLTTLSGLKLSLWGSTANDLYVLSFHTTAPITGPPLFQTEWSNLATLLHQSPQVSDVAHFMSGSTTTQPIAPFVIATVPEPSAFILAIVALVGLWVWRRGE